MAMETGALPDQAPQPLLLDLNDARMTFQIRRGRDVDDLANAPASILPAPPKVRLSCARVYVELLELGL